MVQHCAPPGASILERGRPSPASDVPSSGPWACDGLSFSDIYQRHSAAVFSVASRTGIPRLAAEVVQDTFMHLWRDPERFDRRRGTLRSFLVMVARNRAIDQARAETARSNRELRAAQIHRSDSPDVAAALISADVEDEVRKALARLRPDTRDAIVAAFYGGLSYADVASTLGASEGTVKSRIRRGLIQLHRDLGPSHS